MKLNPCHIQNLPQNSLHPWPHVVVDGLLGSEDFEKLQARMRKIVNSFLCREDDPEQIQFTALADVPLFKFFLSSCFRHFLERTAGCRLELYGPGAIQLRQMTPASPAFPPHFDFIDGQTLVMLYYVAPGWSKERGGELHLLKEETSDFAGPDCKRIAPLENRMVLFFSDETNWHAVSRVHDWTRLLIMAEWRVL